MINDTSDPSNKPDIFEGTDEEWRELSESARQTILESLNDPVSVRAYLRFRDTFEGYLTVRERVLDMVEILVPDGSDQPEGDLLPGFLRSLMETIDPLARVIYRDVDNRIQELKRKRRESLERLMQKAINRESVEEVRQDILNEIEQLEQ